MRAAPHFYARRDLRPPAVLLYVRWRTAREFAGLANANSRESRWLPDAKRERGPVDPSLALRPEGLETPGRPKRTAVLRTARESARLARCGLQEVKGGFELKAREGPFGPLSRFTPGGT